jgi:hypothetical protein
MSKSEWYALTTEEREIHYNRNRPCEHEYKYPEWVYALIGDRLREEFSYDPYFNTAHMIPCQRPVKSVEECPCQMCVERIGLGPLVVMDTRLKKTKGLTSRG